MVLVTVVVLRGSRSVLQGNAVFTFIYDKPCYITEIWATTWISGNWTPLPRFQVSGNKFVSVVPETKNSDECFLRTFMSWARFQNPPDPKIFMAHKTVFQHILFWVFSLPLLRTLVRYYNSVIYFSHKIFKCIRNWAFNLFYFSLDLELEWLSIFQPEFAQPSPALTCQFT